jgi:predicted amidohydrolase
MKIAYYQFRPLFGRVQKNLHRVIETLAHIDADLIVLPELAFTGYYFRDRAECADLAEDVRHSATVDSLQALCRERRFCVVTGFAERNKDKIFNSALLFTPDAPVRIYRKLHLFNTEKNCFDPGDTPLQVYDLRGARVGMMICFDWIFPEVTRSLALLGAHIICHPANLVLSYCQQAMLTRCLENGVFAITTNRFGYDRRPHGALRFTGQSQIVAPKGVLLHRAAAQRNDIYIAEIDPALAEDKKVTAQNEMMLDRRPQFYAALTEPNRPAKNRL